MLSIFVVLLGLSVVHGKNIPYYQGIQQQIDSFLTNKDINENFNSRNMITVPPKCPPGQQLINGVCRDVWRNSPVTERMLISPRNVITVPTNCPDGQELINGVCRDVWRKSAVTERMLISPRNVVTVPTNCPNGQELINGVCRDVWRQSAVTERSYIVPQNVITVPTNCPIGQELVNGVCRDIWRQFGMTDAKYFEEFLKSLAMHMRNPRQAENAEDMNINKEDLLQMNVDRNIINVPNQCPDGYRPDAYGFCREILP